MQSVLAPHTIIHSVNRRKKRRHVLNNYKMTCFAFLTFSEHQARAKGQLRCWGAKGQLQCWGPAGNNGRLDFPNKTKQIHGYNVHKASIGCYKFSRLTGKKDCCVLLPTAWIGWLALLRITILRLPLSIILCWHHTWYYHLKSCFLTLFLAATGKFEEDVITTDTNVKVMVPH